MRWMLLLLAGSALFGADVACAELDGLAPGKVLDGVRAKVLILSAQKDLVELSCGDEKRVFCRVWEGDLGKRLDHYLSGLRTFKTIEFVNGVVSVKRGVKGSCAAEGPPPIGIVALTVGGKKL
jgi:hypothetical protein